MRIRNTLRQSGGAVIKLKRKFSFYGKLAVSIGAGIFFCLFLYYLVDNISNGAVLDWFDTNYMITQASFPDDSGLERITRMPNWVKLKNLLLRTLSITVSLWIASVYFISRLSSSRSERNALRKAGEIIRSCMTQDRDVSDRFPEEYAGISAQIVQIKSKMLRHEQILKEEAARKNDLITYLAHDLKTPLTSVIGYLSLLDEAPDMPAKQKARYTHIALDKANRLEKLINEFFEITRYNLQQIVLEKERVDLYYLLVQLTDEFYPVLSAHGNTIELSADEKCTLYGDPEKLARVFNNLLKNAIHYSYPGTPIDILVEEEADQIILLFRNRGKTISRQQLTSIFDKFFRLDDARNSHTGGAGLGLAIAREIITLHGGTISADSEKELTTFRVSLPL